mmetsp:Transcript_30856/g.89176  ORF Transcript_30856/g.89176 Transcript_30856/m.89176 type:complete len:281 (-) Transcript_30856:113-955(-)
MDLAAGAPSGDAGATGMRPWPLPVIGGCNDSEGAAAEAMASPFCTPAVPFAAVLLPEPFRNNCKTKKDSSTVPLVLEKLSNCPARSSRTSPGLSTSLPMYTAPLALKHVTPTFVEDTASRRCVADKEPNRTPGSFSQTAKCRGWWCRPMWETPSSRSIADNSAEGVFELSWDARPSAWRHTKRQSERRRLGLSASSLAKAATPSVAGRSVMGKLGCVCPPSVRGLLFDFITRIMSRSTLAASRDLNRNIESGLLVADVGDVGLSTVVALSAAPAANPALP